MGQAGTELPVLPLKVLAMPPSLENSRFPGQACSKLAGLTVPMHCSKPAIQTAQSSSKLLAAAATLLSNQEAEET